MSYDKKYKSLAPLKPYLQVNTVTNKVLSKLLISKLYELGTTTDGCKQTTDNHNT